MSGRRTARALSTSVAAAFVALALTFGPASIAEAYWTSQGTGTGASSTELLAAPTDVTVPASSTAPVDVSWTASAGVITPTGYFVTRTSAITTEAACDTSPEALTADTSCVDNAASGDSYVYRVTAVYRTWTARSAPSGSVDVTAPGPDPRVGETSNYSVLGGAVANTLTTDISGDLGVSPAGTVSGFPDGTVGGNIHLNDEDAATAMLIAADDYLWLSTETPTTTFSGDNNGRTYTAGVHYTAAAFALTGTMTLSGTDEDVFIFQIDAALNTAANSHVVLAGGVLPSNVYWQVNGAAGTGADSTFVGSILASTAITLGARSVLIGRALAVGTVTMADATVRFTDALPPVLSITGGATVVTKDTTPTLSGTTNAGLGRAVRVTVAGQVLTAFVQVGGTWSITTEELIAGSYPVVAKVKDAYGNGATATQTIVVEVNPPTIDVGAAATFSVLANSSVVSPGISHLGGDLGVGLLGTITGFPPGTVGGVIHSGDLEAAAAKAALLAAYADGATRVAHTSFAGDQNGHTYHAGVHETLTAFELTGTMTLDGEGNPNAVFIFHIGAAMNTAADSTVVLTGSATAANVFWVVDGAVTTGARSVLVGTLLADGPITMGSLTRLTGRALSTGTVTLADVTVVAP